MTMRQAGSHLVFAPFPSLPFSFLLRICTISRAVAEFAHKWLLERRTFLIAALLFGAFLLRGLTRNAFPSSVVSKTRRGGARLSPSSWAQIARSDTYYLFHAITRESESESTKSEQDHKEEWQNFVSRVLRSSSKNRILRNLSLTVLPLHVSGEDGQVNNPRARARILFQSGLLFHADSCRVYFGGSDDDVLQTSLVVRTRRHSGWFAEANRRESGEYSRRYDDPDSWFVAAMAWYLHWQGDPDVSEEQAAYFGDKFTQGAFDHLAGLLDNTAVFGEGSRESGLYRKFKEWLEGMGMIRSLTTTSKAKAEEDAGSGNRGGGQHDPQKNNFARNAYLLRVADSPTEMDEDFYDHLLSNAKQRETISEVVADCPFDAIAGAVVPARFGADSLLRNNKMSARGQLSSGDGVVAAQAAVATSSESGSVLDQLVSMNAAASVRDFPIYTIPTTTWKWRSAILVNGNEEHMKKLEHPQASAPAPAPIEKESAGGGARDHADPDALETSELLETSPSADAVSVDEDFSDTTTISTTVEELVERVVDRAALSSATTETTVPATQDTTTGITGPTISAGTSPASAVAASTSGKQAVPAAAGSPAVGKATPGTSAVAANAAGPGNTEQ
ncbi:unnamed protein product [Amoebophrya sp. A25]|nr:unnamed protein product [Amoebophrya sp. A25]|eukprot:GSA25T00012322001.1